MGLSRGESGFALSTTAAFPVGAARRGAAGVVLGIRQGVDTHYGYEVLFRDGGRHVFYRDELVTSYGDTLLNP